MKLKDYEVAFLEKQLLTIISLSKNGSRNPIVTLEQIKMFARVGHEEIQRFKKRDEDDGEVPQL